MSTCQVDILSLEIPFLGHQSNNFNKVAYAVGNQALLLHVIRIHVMGSNSFRELYQGVLFIEHIYSKLDDDYEEKIMLLNNPNK